jgi:hypothetical protein
MHGEAMHAQQSYRGRDKHHSYERTITGRKPPVRGRVGHLANLAYPDSQAHPDTTLHSDDEHDTAKTAPRGKAGQKPPVIKTEELSPEDIQQV